MVENFYKGKLACTQTVDLIKAICEEEERNVERTIVGEGAFLIRRQFAPTLPAPFHAYTLKSHVNVDKNKLDQKIHSVLQEDFPLIS